MRHSSSPLLVDVPSLEHVLEAPFTSTSSYNCLNCSLTNRG